MPQPIHRHEVQRLLAEGAQLVEVLKREEYDKEHLPGAISLPLRSMDSQSVAVLDRNKPVIVYCWDEA
ncbi:MAG TPA: rhodanese-like domain-containing protein [Candidatus Dormibacteraeota bacterium]|nr:rhodanese-like domain-containing protein [Candidatus Dormibacteraeota bacterium]